MSIAGLQGEESPAWPMAINSVECVKFLQFGHGAKGWGR
jgi:hypothetical protein